MTSLTWEQLHIGATAGSGSKQYDSGSSPPNVPGLPVLWMSALRLCGLRWPGGGGRPLTLQTAAALLRRG